MNLPHFLSCIIRAAKSNCCFSRESRLQPYRHADHEFGVVGLGLVGLDAEAYGEATEAGDGVVDAYLLVVGLLQLLGQVAGVADEVVAEEH